MQATAAKAYAAMTAKGIVRVDAEFYGGNDEGGYEQITCYDANGTELGVDIPVYEYGNRDPIGAWLDQVLDGEYGGFSGDFNVSGSVILDAATKKTTMKASETDWVAQQEREF